MLRHLLMLLFTLHCMLAVPLAQPKEETKAHEMESLFEDDMNKRSKEVIMYGNQQNKGKSTQAGMIDSDLVPQDSNDSDEDDEKNGHGGSHKNDKHDEHQSNDDHSQSEESEESYARVLPILPVMSSQQVARPKQNVEDILPDVIDAYKAEEDWENYKNTPYDYYRDLVFRRKRSMDRRHAMKKRNYVAAREHLIKRRSDKRSRFRRDLNLDDEELMQLINMLKENKYSFDRKRRQYYRPDLDENDDDGDDENEKFDADVLNSMFAKDAHQEYYNPYYYPSYDKVSPPSNIFRYNNDDSGESDEDDNDDNNDDDEDWKHMGPARSIDIQRRSEFFYPPMDYRFMMVPGQKRRLPMHEDEAEGFWGSFDDKRAVKKKRGYYFGEEDEKDDDDDDDDEESDEEKLNQILEMASYMKSHKRNYRSIR